METINHKKEGELLYKDKLNFDKWKTFHMNQFSYINNEKPIMEVLFFCRRTIGTDYYTVRVENINTLTKMEDFLKVITLNNRMNHTRDAIVIGAVIKLPYLFNNDLTNDIEECIILISETEFSMNLAAINIHCFLNKDSTRTERQASNKKAVHAFIDDYIATEKYLPLLQQKQNYN